MAPSTRVLSALCFIMLWDTALGHCFGILHNTRMVVTASALSELTHVLNNQGSAVAAAWSSAPAAAAAAALSLVAAFSALRAACHCQAM